MTTRTNELEQWLSDVLITGAAFADYWCDGQVIDSGDVDDHGQPIAEYAFLWEHETGKEFKVTLDDLERGIRLAIQHGVSWQCGDGGLPRAYETDGREGDYDAIDADVVLQFATFGEVVYA